MNTVILAAWWIILAARRIILPAKCNPEEGIDPPNQFEQLKSYSKKTLFLWTLSPICDPYAYIGMSGRAGGDGGGGEMNGGTERG